MNQYINNRITKLLLFMGVMAVSCNPGDFGTLNVNPNEPSEANTAALLTAAQTSLPGGVIGQGTILTVSYPNLYVQYLSDKQYTENSRYSTIGFNYGSIYTGPLDNLQLIININSDSATAKEAQVYGSNENQIAAATILKSYLFLHLTDRFGDIPYTEALKGRENFRPAFTPQQEIYYDLFEKLKEASDMIDPSGTIEGDIMFGGNMEQWRIFGNTIRLVMALRLSEVDEQKGIDEFNDAFNDGVISSNDENVVYNYEEDNNHDNPWEDAFETRLDFAISEPFANTLLDLGDPRIEVYADPAAASGTYVGMPYGVSESEAGAVANSSISFLGEQMRQQTSPTYIYTYAQVLFSLAEAAHRGWIGGGDAAAADYYYDAIKASWEQWGVFNQASFTTYIAQTEVAYTPGTAMQKIALQKWIALFLNGYEAWAEWRRLDYPVLEPAPASLNPEGIPVRQAYPAFEATLNSANYNEAVNRMTGGDDLNTPVWWDK